MLRDFSRLGDKAGCDHPSLSQSYVDNLRRLGLIDVPMGMRLTEQVLYDEIEQVPFVINLSS